ncbi:phosphatidylethanolamine-binding protein, partial [Chytriomyces sp. MP71]
MLGRRFYVTIGARGRMRCLGKSEGGVFVEPRLGCVRAYDEAVLVLNGLLESQKEDKVVRGLVRLDTHWRFNAGRVDWDALATQQLDDPLAPALERLKNRRFATVTAPRLAKAADAARIFADAFPGRDPSLVRPSLNVELNFENTRWEACAGQPVPPNWALYSPRVTINTHSDIPTKYTLVLMDLDRPSLSTKSIHEWCHWLITDIEVTNRLTIQPGSSPFLVAPGKDTASLTGVSFHPTAPVNGEPVLPGKVVFPYVPPHPANSNPRQIHRYLLTVFEQSEGKTVEVQLETLRAEALNERMAPSEQATVAAWEKDFIGENEETMKVLERGAFSTWGFGVKHGLKVAGLAFFTSGWNLHTPDIYTRLGIHEPVFGQFPNNPVTEVHKLNQATQTATVFGDQLLSSFTLGQIKNLNAGAIPAVPKFKLPSRSSIKAEELNRSLAASAAKAKSSGKNAGGASGKGKKSSVPVKVLARASALLTPRMPRLTTVGSVAVVRSKKTDVAATSMGE